MLIIPAIDLKDGQVVRLYQGKSRKKVYANDPCEIAKKWQRQGARLIHVVDLDGALGGKIKNLKGLKQILNSVQIPVQFGGGIRDLATINKLLDLGVYRLVLGTKAAQDGKFLEKAIKKFKDKVIVSIDAKAGRIRIQGWKSLAKRADPLEFAGYLKGLGFKELIYTDISLDGTLKGPNIKGLTELLHKVRIKVISSGGIAALGDIIKLKSLSKNGLSGVIIGKALYEGKFSLSQALKSGL
jgi:phosphoribosylformimino-5-aminoimidazole carboxamide ribotide isomerase